VNFVRHRDTQVDVNLTPLIDVVFLLLIFFMVSTSFTLETQLDLTLPAADGSAEASEEALEQEFVIAISADGKYSINGHRLIGTTLEQLRLATVGALEAKRPEQIILMADANTPHQRVIDMLDVLQQAGQTQIQMKTQSRAASEPGGSL
jgi:biopolymer transport protein ExbD